MINDEKFRKWADEFLDFPYTDVMPAEPVLQVVAKGSLQDVYNNDGGKIKIGQTEYDYGIMVHARSYLRVYSPEPIRKFTASVGIPYSGMPRGAVRFSVVANGLPLAVPVSSKGCGDPGRFDITISGDNTHIIELLMDHEPENPGFNRGVWAQPAIETASGIILRLDKIKRGVIPCKRAKYPFSFTYGGVPSDELLPGWLFTRGEETESSGMVTYTVSWRQPGGGLKASLDISRYAGYPAVEILPWFENASVTDTDIIENIQSIDAMFCGPIEPVAGAAGTEVAGNIDLCGFYRLHKNRPDRMQNDQYTVDPYEVDYYRPHTLGAALGRCSTLTLPFFKIETGYGAIIFGLGWLGQWKAELTSDGHFLNVKAGQELTCFKLLPGEKVRQMRVLMLNWESGGHNDTWEANSVFRQLIYKHYAATIGGQKPLPRLWVNGYMTGISCLRDTSAENERVAKAYGEKFKGIDSYVTDGGWFKGGYCSGEGNYLDFDYDRWPNGIETMLEVTRSAGMHYGLWFDVERTHPDSQIRRDHPDWLLEDRTPGNVNTYFTRWFGNPDAVKGTYEQTAHYMKMDGFNFYRQDYNGKPLDYWRSNDAPDRQGICEALHVMGLLQYWHMLAEGFPEGIREECAGGGGRIDLDTVSIMHHHQKSDQHGVSFADQSALMGLSHYLPNNCFHGFCGFDTEYGFRSLVAGSICHGLREITDSGFDPALTQRMIDEYYSVRHLLIDAWYPLTLQSIAPDQWLASQYHRKDLEEGMVIAYRREQSPYRSLSAGLRWIDPGAMYVLKYHSYPENKPVMVKGSGLMEDFTIEIPNKKASELIIYRKQ